MCSSAIGEAPWTGRGAAKGQGGLSPGSTAFQGFPLLNGLPVSADARFGSWMVRAEGDSPASSREKRVRAGKDCSTDRGKHIKSHVCVWLEGVVSTRASSLALLHPPWRFIEQRLPRLAWENLLTNVRTCLASFNGRPQTLITTSLQLKGVTRIYYYCLIREFRDYARHPDRQTHTRMIPR
jgi:hypothetical protein